MTMRTDNANVELRTLAASDSSSEDKASRLQSNSSRKRKPTASPTKDAKVRKVARRPSLPSEVVVLQTIAKKRSVYVNHSYRDFSTVPPRACDDENMPSTAKFNLQLHHILSRDDLNSIVRWLPHGRAFVVVVPNKFEQVVCPEYFQHRRYSTFLRCLGNNGFQQLTKEGPDRGAFYHESFLKGMPHLVRYMPEPKNYRKLVPCPEDEPDFYTITKSFPLREPGFVKPRPVNKGDFRQLPAGEAAVESCAETTSSPLQTMVMASPLLGAPQLQLHTATPASATAPVSSIDMHAVLAEQLLASTLITSHADNLVAAFLLKAASEQSQIGQSPVTSMNVPSNQPLQPVTSSQTQDILNALALLSQLQSPMHPTS